MALKNILVHVDNLKSCAARVDIALELAREHGAHVSAIYVIPYPYIPPYMTAGYVPAEFIEEQANRARQDAAVAEAAFRKQAGPLGVEYEWRMAEGYPADVIALNARYADLAVMGQADPEEQGDFVDTDLPAEVAMSAGRPVLVVPYIGAPKTLAKNIMVAWNGSREATRAVNDALPLLERADNVKIMAINPQKDGDTHGDVPGADIALHLARHGVKAEASQTASDQVDVGAVLLSRAADFGADLVVMGAYGHSRTRELIMGGVTRELLRHMTVPVLLSH